MIKIEYEKGHNLGYVWPWPPKKPTEFFISLHWGELCAKKWWKFGKGGHHSHAIDHSNLCKSAFILKGLEVVVVDDGIEYLCRINNVFRHKIARCFVIIKAEIVEVESNA